VLPSGSIIQGIDVRFRDHIDEYSWSLPQTRQFIASPAVGVERMPLFRIGRETARATSLVRYAPGSVFAEHQHPFGEEFLVLDGEFADGAGRYPAFTWVHNPHGSAHSPRSDSGCLLFVRLRQMQPDDSVQRVLRLEESFPETGMHEQLLHRCGDETVVWVRAAAQVRLARNANFHAQEALIVRGRVEWQTDQVRTLEPHSWIRVPPGCPLRLTTLEPSLIYLRVSPRHFGDPGIR
jgi:quercetin dioxygenase-like cupin family protein